MVPECQARPNHFTCGIFISSSQQCCAEGSCCSPSHRQGKWDSQWLSNTQPSHEVQEDSIFLCSLSCQSQNLGYFYMFKILTEYSHFSIVHFYFLNLLISIWEPSVGDVLLIFNESKIQKVHILSILSEVYFRSKCFLLLIFNSQLFGLYVCLFSSSLLPLLVIVL